MPPRPRELSSRCAVFRSSTSALVTTTSFSSKDAKRARPGQRLWSAALAGDCSPFSFCEPEACSILLRGANEFMLEEASRSAKLSATNMWALALMES